MPTSDDDRDTVRTPAPGLGYAAAVEFIFMSGQSPIVQFSEPTFDIAAVTRKDGTELRIVARQITWDETQRNWLREQTSKALAKSSLPPTLDAGRQLRLILMGDFGPDRVRAAWEVALDP